MGRNITVGFQGSRGPAPLLKIPDLSLSSAQGSQDHSQQ
jgi:hypothetical protein